MSGIKGPAHSLEGKELEGGWRVRTKVDLEADDTGSTTSVGYIADHAASGTDGFVKAIDYQSALDEEEPSRALELLTAKFNAECDLLDLCQQRSLNRVVRALAQGTVRIDGFTPSVVNYLIFELAEGDARDMRKSADFGMHSPGLRLAHHAAVGMSQLHGIGATHQDVKPSNVLVWNLEAVPEGKLGDLGCAHLNGRPAPHDELEVAGDRLYSAPEMLYLDPNPLGPEDRRLAADLYMLGNLLMFLLVGVDHSGCMYAILDRSHHWSKWQGSFEDVLPALVDAHVLVLDRLNGAFNNEVNDALILLINELSHPDPRIRGSAKARDRGHNPFDLHRYITRLDLIYKRAAIAERVSA